MGGKQTPKDKKTLSTGDERASAASETGVLVQKSTNGKERKIPLVLSDCILMGNK